MLNLLFSVEPHSKEVTSKNIESNDPWFFSGKSFFDSDRTTRLFDIKSSHLGAIFPGKDRRRYSAKWEETFPGYVSQTTKMQDFVLTV
jgi:WD40 repeat protein